MLRALATLLAIALSVSAASAHTGLGDAHGFVHGFLHPITGVDHVLAMVAVGLFAAHLGGRALWLVPLAFVSVMIAGGVLGASGIALPGVEIGIALSVVVLGLVVASGLSLPLAGAAALVGVFALFHGHAHGAEMPDDAAGLAYGAGFVLATALLHAAGVALGIGLARWGSVWGLRTRRLGGAAMAVVGLALLTSAATGATRAQDDPVGDAIKLGARVHGGFGAFIPLGMRIGEDALQRLGARPRDVTVTYQDSDAAPCACIADGVSLATQASVGQRTFVIAPDKAPAGDLADLLVRSRASGRTVRYLVPASALAQIGQWNKTFDERGRYEAVMRADGLFTVVADEVNRPAR